MTSELSAHRSIPPSLDGVAAASEGLAVARTARDRKLRIALVVGDFPVISETFVINIAAGLVERGHDVSILAMSGQRADDPGMHDIVARANLMAGLRRPRAGRLLLAPFGSDVEGEDIQRWGLGRRACAFLAQAGMMAPMPRFDVVHCQFSTLGLQVMRHLSLGTLRTRALVLHVRGRDVTSFPAVHGEDVYREAFARADLLIANCEHFRQRAIALGAPPENVAVIGSAIHTDQFVPAARDRSPSEAEAGGLRLIAVGRLVEKKGFADAVRAVAEVAKAVPAVTLDIVGEGPLRSELARLIADLGLTDRVSLSGALAHEEVVRRLDRSDILLAPSVTAGSGDQDAPVNTLKEAMAMELPVVATRHGGIPELVIDGETGYLVPERTPGLLADAILRLAGERQNWRRMGEIGRRRVIEAYDQRSVMDRLIASYRTVLEGRKAN